VLSYSFLRVRVGNKQSEGSGLAEMMELSDFYFTVVVLLFGCQYNTLIGVFPPGYTNGNDPHFFVPLSNGDNLCYSVQGEPDFMFSWIKRQACTVECSVCFACKWWK